MPIGSEGWASTGASIAGSSIIDSAKLPVKHMPIAPTPLPPASESASRARPRSHTAIGPEELARKAWNSRAMQPRASAGRA